MPRVFIARTDAFVVDWVFAKITDFVPNTSTFHVEDYFKHSTLGYAPVPGGYPKKRILNGKTIDVKFVNDVDYNFNYSRQRINPFRPNKNAKKFALLFGGSIMFGEGLNDHETIPALFQKEFPEYRVHNFSYRGYGPQQMLANIESGLVDRQVKTDDGVIAYTYYALHLQRVIGSLAMIRWAGGKHPYYYLDRDGKLTRNGEFSTGRKWTTLLYFILSKSAIFTSLGLDIPPKITNEHRRLACRILNRSRFKLRVLYPTAKFLLVIGPTSARNDPMVEGCFKRWGIDYLDLRTDNAEIVSKYHIQNDGHLNSVGVQYILRQMKKYWNLK